MRSILFVSHANPEDNVATQWLAVRLAAEGYQVWSDLTHLIGGEDFWRDIEQILRDKASEFVYILTRTSNTKDGPLSELHLAKQIAKTQQLPDFVIPLVFDDLRGAEFNIELTRLNAISMFPSWAEGLAQLLLKLQKDVVPCDPPAGRVASQAWWTKQTPDLRRQSEGYLSNWFAITARPSTIYVHQLVRRGTGLLDLTIEAAYPAFQQAAWLISFAPRADIQGQLPPDVSITRSTPVALADPRSSDIPMDADRVRDFLSRLLTEAWEMHSATRLPYYMSGDYKCFYFPHSEDATYMRVRRGVKGGRQLAGIRRSTAPDGTTRTRYWHFGVDARTRLNPVPSFIVFPHVIFSDDGQQPWISKARMHQARRSQCKDWWNAQWRDRVLGAIGWLADGAETMTIPVSSGESLSVSAMPLEFMSPVSYDDPGAAVPVIIPTEYFDADDDEDDDY